MSRIGFAGLGRMGARMAARLIDVDTPVTVWNRSSAKAGPLVRAGATHAQSPHELVASSDIIFSMIADDAAAAQLYEGPEGFLSCDCNGKLFVEMSTLRPRTTRRLETLVEGCGARFLECPVNGTLPHARDGRLVLLAGGSADSLARAEPHLQRLGHRIFHVGPVGAAAHAKLASNLLTGLYIQSLAEASALVSRAGGSRDLFLDILSEGPFATPFLKMRRHVIAGAVPDSSEIAASIGLMRKDLLSVSAACADCEMPAPAAAAAAASFSAACAAGWADRDLSELVSFFVAEMPRPRT